MMSLTNRVAIVTGGGSGIGLGVASALAREGCRVVIAGRDPAKLERAAAEATHASGNGAVLARACDVTDREALADLVAWTQAHAGPPEIVVNSAGINVMRRSMAELAPALTLVT